MYILSDSGRYRNTDTAINRILLFFFSNNNVSVQGKGLDSVTITWRSESRNSKRRIYQNGKEASHIKNVYGPQMFEVFKNGKLIDSFVQFKVAWWHTNDYIFKVNGNSCERIVIGPDELYK